MVSISYMSNDEIIEDIREKELGSQSRLHDYTTGIYTRIFLRRDGNNKTYSLCEAGCGTSGFIEAGIDVYETIGLEDEGYELIEEIIESINSIRDLTEEEVNKMINEGFLNLLSIKKPEIKEINGFGIFLTAEKILKEIENNVSIDCSKVLNEINRMLEMEDIRDEERKALKILQATYENDLFKMNRETLYLLKEKQENVDKNRTMLDDNKHSSEEISEDLKEISRIGIKDSTLKDIISSTEIEDKSKIEEK